MERNGMLGKPTGVVLWIVLSLIYLALFDAAPLVINEFTHTLVAGLDIGSIQRPVLERRFGAAARWPLVTCAAMASGAALSALLVHGFGDSGEAGSILGMALYGLITGVVLSRWIAASGDVGATPARAAATSAA